MSSRTHVGRLAQACGTHTHNTRTIALPYTHARDLWWQPHVYIFTCAREHTHTSTHPHLYVLLWKPIRIAYNTARSVRAHIDVGILYSFYVLSKHTRTRVALMAVRWSFAWQGGAAQSTTHTHTNSHKPASWFTYRRRRHIRRLHALWHTDFIVHTRNGR